MKAVLSLVGVVVRCIRRLVHKFNTGFYPEDDPLSFRNVDGTPLEEVPSMKVGMPDGSDQDNRTESAED